jgi:hypothetical protein
MSPWSSVTRRETSTMARPDYSTNHHQYARSKHGSKQQETRLQVAILPESIRPFPYHDCLHHADMTLMGFNNCLDLHGLRNNCFDRGPGRPGRTCPESPDHAGNHRSGAWHKAASWICMCACRHLCKERLDREKAFGPYLYYFCSDDVYWTLSRADFTSSSAM